MLQQDKQIQRSIMPHPPAIMGFETWKNEDYSQIAHNYNKEAEFQNCAY
jgi:hypothetical protein